MGGRWELRVAREPEVLVLLEVTEADFVGASEFAAEDGGRVGPFDVWEPE